MRIGLLTASVLAALGIWATPAAAKDWTTQSFTLTTNGQCVQIDAGGMGTASWEITGTWTGTISMYIRGQNNTPNAVDVSKADTPSTAVNSTTTNGIWSGPVASYKYAVACATAAMTGTAIVQLSAAGTGGGSGGGGGGGGGGVIEGMGIAGTPAGGLLTVQGASGMTPLQVESNNATVMLDATGLSIVSGIGSTNSILSQIQAALSPDAVVDQPSITTGPQILCTGSTATPTAMSADGDATRVWCDLNGRVQTNIAQINGVAPSMGNGASGTGVQRFTLANDSTGVLAAVTSLTQLGGVAVPVEDSAATANGTGIYAMTQRRDAAASSAGSDNDNAYLGTDANGYLWSRSADPCSALPNVDVPISTTADVALITAASGKRNIICGGVFVAGAAEIISIWEGTTGGTCGSASAAVIGSTTEANGVSLAANGGFAIPNRIRGLSTNVDTCLRISGSNRISGYITYVQE